VAIIFSSYFKRKRDSLQRTLEDWKTARTKAGSNIRMVDGTYVLAVFGIVMLLMGISWGSGIIAILFMLLGIVALSKQVRAIAIPHIYDAVASRLNWVPYTEALRMEMERTNGAVQHERSDADSSQAKHSANTAYDAVEPGSSEVRSALDIYRSLSDDEKQKAVPMLVEYLMEHGVSRTYFLAYFKEKDEQMKLRIGVSSIEAYIEETRS